MMMRRTKYRNRKNGLILLIVLGMLALFTLLAVTYVVSAGASRAASKAIEVKSRNEHISIHGTAKKVFHEVLRGTNNQKSALYQNDLLGDIFDRKPIRTSFGPYVSGLTVCLFDSRQLSTTNPLTNVNLVKVSLQKDAQLNGPLSDYENEYNSRVLTVLEGPLAGQSFRILKYVGHVGTNDPNIDETPWSTKTYTDTQSNVTQYSVLLDLDEVQGESLTGQYVDADGSIKSISLRLDEWISRFGKDSLFFFNNGASYVGYKVVINGAAFNNAGIGVEEVAALPPTMFGGPDVPVRGYGNIDSRRLLRIPSSRPKISPALLTHYDYLQNSVMMATNAYDGSVGVDAIGVPRTNRTQFRLSGGSNEGYDVPDWRDPWLAHISQNKIIPSFHRPAVINHISHLFGDPNSMTLADVTEMLTLIDASSARVMNYLGTNPNFQENNPNALRLPSNFTWSAPTPTPTEITMLQGYVRLQILGPWDVDNDGDGIPDSVWVDPALPIVYSPDGRRLRPLAAIMIQDLDGRINLNTSGDRAQGYGGFAAATNGNFKRGALPLAQGFGYGPAEISLNALFRNTASLLTSGPNTFSFLDELAGARRFTARNSDGTIDYTSGILDRFPGQRRLPGDYTIGLLNERENYQTFQHNRTPGLPLARRGVAGISTDRNGNMSVVSPDVVDADPLSNPFASGQVSENNFDRYESAAMGSPISDDPLSLNDLEAILRRFDEDAVGLSNRLPRRLNEISGYNLVNTINREITTRSAELRYPNLAAAMKVHDASMGNVVGASAPGYLRYIQMLHSQRYRVRTFPAQASDDPEISVAALSELFPMDFAKGLRMDLNRPFGDGVDNNNNGQVDEPLELISTAQLERFPIDKSNVVNTSAAGEYVRELKMASRKDGAQVGDSSPDNPLPSLTRGALGSRQLLARNLYCLAQLIVPRDYEFPGMSGASGLNKVRIRAKALAQWAVNVVDFRDTDSAMTRFEYDILPFGCGTNGGLSARPAYWAPDRIEHTVNGTSNKDYVGVVFGMEMPELVLSESLALHDKRLRDTDMDSTGKTTTDPTDPDEDLDQYRFPQASLYLELFAPRTTDVPVSNFAQGAPSSMYRVAPNAESGQNEVQLDLAKLAPSVAVWGAQPVWRIAISEPYTAANQASHPSTMLKNNPASMQTVTHQWSTERVATTGSLAGQPAVSGATSIARGNDMTHVEQYIGNDLRYDLSSTSINPPTGFDRFVWFSSVRPAAGQRIPDLLPALASNSVVCVYSATSDATVPGGSYVVVGPRSTTPVGSLTHNPFTGTLFTPTLLRSAMSVPDNRPIFASSFQRIEMVAGSGIDTYMINGTRSNAAWTTPGTRPIKNTTTIVCQTDAPAGWNTPLPTESGGPSRFPGVGLNISFPTPVAGQGIWTAGNLPTARLNTDDTAANRDDGTDGFGSNTVAPDSWVDTAATPITGNFPDEPIDKSNPLLVGKYRTGTYENVRVAYLQRLADPDSGYDPIINPYITVDWLSIDLHVFNGEAPLAADPEEGATPSLSFQSRYKTGQLSPLSTGYAITDNKGVSYYSPVVADLRTSVVQSNPSAATINRESYFMYQLGYNVNANGGDLVGVSGTTLGYVNTGYYRNGFSAGGTVPSAADIAASVPADYDAFGPPRNPGVFAFKGAPERIGGALWLNRPFASPYELMLVPLTGPGQFGLYHSVATNDGRNPFSANKASGRAGGVLPSFQTTNAWQVNVPPSANPDPYWATSVIGTNPVADWPLLLDFVETAPPFADANKYYRVDTMEALGSASYGLNSIARRFLNSYIPKGYTLPDTGNATDPARSEPATVRGPSYLAPFNIKPSYVAAGKINLNTISFDTSGHSHALKALEELYLANERGSSTTSLASAFFESRQGYASGAVPNNSFFGAPVPGMHPEFPTEFAGAFKPAMSSNLAPEVNNAAATEQLRSKYGVESMLLRSSSVTANNQANPSNDGLLFAANIDDDQNKMQPFIRMQRVMRLPNLVTNQSNVFAVWVTVSLFEYDPITGFGNEYVGETGLPERERQFYIVDRSIPVGYKPGENLNSERTILLQRTLP